MGSKYQPLYIPGNNAPSDVLQRSEPLSAAHSSAPRTGGRANARAHSELRSSGRNISQVRNGYLPKAQATQVVERGRRDGRDAGESFGTRRLSQAREPLAQGISNPLTRPYSPYSNEKHSRSSYNHNLPAHTSSRADKILRGSSESSEDFVEAVEMPQDNERLSRNQERRPVTSTRSVSSHPVHQRPPSSLAETRPSRARVAPQGRWDRQETSKVYPTQPGPPPGVAQEEHDRLNSKYQQTLTELTHLQSQVATLNQTCQDLKTHNDRLQSELRNVRRQLNDAVQLSEVRGKELVGAQVFLTKADTISVSELKQKVTDLNEENFQAAAWLSESLKPRRSSQRNESDRIFVTHIMGKSMLDALESCTSPAPIHLAQLLIQMCLTWFSISKIQKWCEGDDNTNRFLSNVYGKICETEEQAVRGRWRAITHSHTRLSSDTWGTEFISALQQILPVAGYSGSFSLSKLERKLKPIFKAIQDVRNAVGEQVTSSDFMVYLVSPGTRYDHRTMEDALEDARSSNGKGIHPVDIVIASSGIGLFQTVSHGKDGRSDKQFRNALSPKVILQSAMSELLDIPKPAKNFV